jgi:hypothetical protein
MPLLLVLLVMIDDWLSLVGYSIARSSGTLRLGESVVTTRVCSLLRLLALARRLVADLLPTVGRCRPL